MRIVSWNIQSAGTARRKAIVAALRRLSPDVVVLIDVPVAPEDLFELLHSAGFAWQVCADSANSPAKVLIASRLRANRVSPSADVELCDRWAEVVIPQFQIRIAGVYIPVTGNQPSRKKRMWTAVREAAAERASERFILIGDWNTGDVPLDKSHPSRPFKFTSEHRALVASGFDEAWRALNPDTQEYSWFRSDNRGFRIDHAFLSPKLREALVDCRYSHEERSLGLSDHSLLIVDLKLQNGAHSNGIVEAVRPAGQQYAAGNNSYRNATVKVLDGPAA